MLSYWRPLYPPLVRFKVHVRYYMLDQTLCHKLTEYIRLCISPLSENLPVRLSCWLINHDAVRFSTVSGIRKLSPRSLTSLAAAITSSAVAVNLQITNIEGIYNVSRWLTPWQPFVLKCFRIFGNCSFWHSCAYQYNASANGHLYMNSITCRNSLHG